MLARCFDAYAFPVFRAILHSLARARALRIFKKILPLLPLLPLGRDFQALMRGSIVAVVAVIFKKEPFFD